MKKKVVKGRSSRKKQAYKGRGPSGKLKHSKVAKLMKLAKARSRKTKEKMKKGYKEPLMRFDLALQKFVPDLAAIKKIDQSLKKGKSKSSRKKRR